MLAINELGATPRAILFIAAFALLVVAGIGLKLGKEGTSLVGLGLACYMFVFAWNALAAT